MAKQLSLVLEKHQDSSKTIGPLNINESDGRSHRYFVPGPTKLLQANVVYLVGFFSHKQKGAAWDHFGDLDQRLTKQIPKYQGILSYSTMALPAGDFGNLVLLADEEIKSKWMHGETHNRAVALSPDYYQYVRINNGVLPPNGIMDPDSLRIIRVKYYDYMVEPHWKAVRELMQG